MSDYFAANIQLLKDTPLSELINGDDAALSNAAMNVHIAFSNMDAGQIITASHHDYRLSDELRQAARKMAAQIESSAYGLAEQDRENAAYAQADWELDCRKAEGY